MSDADGADFPPVGRRHKEDIDYRRKLSVSRLNSVSKCGRAYELKRVLKMSASPAAWTVRGIAAHSAIEEWEKSDRSLDVIDYYVNQAWPSALMKILEESPRLKTWTKTPRVKTVERDLELRKDDGLQQVQTYVDRALEEQELWRVLESEISFEIETSSFWIVGHIDQIREWIPTGDRYIVDVKTGGDDGENNRQLGIYRYGWYSLTNEWIDWGSYYYPKLDRFSADIDLSVYSEGYILEEFEKLDFMLAQKLFVANPSFNNCKFCDVSQHCLEAKIK